MEVIDNGSGFFVPKSSIELAPDGRFGLLGIRERTDLVGARLEMNPL